ncbi:hypothetical protein A4X13_0g9222, partial [Tilletia indica]
MSVTHRNSLRLVFQGPRRRCGDGKTDDDGSRSLTSEDADGPRIRRQGRVRTLMEAAQPMRQGRIDEAKT